MSEFDSWKQEATRHQAKAQVCFDRALVAEFEDASKQLDEATKSQMLEGAPVELENRVSELEKQVEEKTREFVFEAIGHRAWRRLIADHPPTQDADDVRAGYNIDTFVPAALARCCVSPGLTVEQAEWIVSELPEGVYSPILEACFRANLQGGDEKKAAATAAAARSRNRSLPR